MFLIHLLLSQKNVKEALSDELWVIAMQEELEQFVRNDVWSLVSRPKNTNVIEQSGCLRIRLIQKVTSPEIKPG